MTNKIRPRGLAYAAWFCDGGVDCCFAVVHRRSWSIRVVQSSQESSHCPQRPWGLARLGTSRQWRIRDGYFESSHRQIVVAVLFYSSDIVLQFAIQTQSWMDGCGNNGTGPLYRIPWPKYSSTHGPFVPSVRHTWLRKVLMDVWTDRLKGWNKLWHYQMQLTTFILTFFVGQAYALWREVYTTGRNIQGRWNDIGILWRLTIKTTRSRSSCQTRITMTMTMNTRKNL